MIPFIDLASQYKQIEDVVKNRIHHVLEHGRFIMGPEVQELENDLSNYLGVKHSIGVSSGTDALQISLMALGVGSGDEVIIPDFTFFATAEVISLLGAKPVFADVDRQTFCVSPKSIEASISSKTKAIIPVSMFGQCADFKSINELANHHNIAVIEDGAQSFGATHHGLKSLNLSTIGCTSFFPSKPLGAYGDGGACFTNDDDLAEKIREIRIHGQSQRYTHTTIGLNGRLDTMQAAVLIEKLKIFDSEKRLRTKVAQRYSSKLGERYSVPHIEGHNESVYAQYTLKVENRSQIIDSLKAKNIPVAIHYPIPVSKQPVFSDGDYKTCENAQYLSDRVVSLPFHPYMTEADQDLVIDALLNI